MSRNRVIYQSQALFIAPSSTGAQVSGTGQTTPLGPTGSGYLVSGASLLKKLDRVQNCDFNFTINRQDINEFGKLSRIDSIVMEAPTVGLDFSYYVTDGLNERLMGFNIYGGANDSTNTTSSAQAISGLLQDPQGNNYYILTVQEGEDVVGSNVLKPESTNTIIGIGNGFISEYSFDASVGAIPTASVTVEAFNIKSDALTGNADGWITGSSPAVDIFSKPAAKLTGYNTAYQLSGDFSTGNSTVSALRPGDIVLTLPTSKGLTDLDSAHVQSFKFTIPLARTVLQRLGNTFGYARVVNVPMNMDVTVSAIVSELRNQNLFDLLVSPTKQDFAITLKDSSGTGKIYYGISGAIFQGESYSENIGDNQTVDLTYTVQIGGANDTQNGIFMSGSFTADTITSGFYKLGTGKLV